MLKSLNILLQSVDDDKQK